MSHEQETSRQTSRALPEARGTRCLPLLFAIGLLGCWGCGEAGKEIASAQIEVTKGALGTEKWVASVDGNHHTEPFVFAGQVGTKRELVVTFNATEPQMGNGLVTACSRDGGTTWLQRTYTFANAPGTHCCDTSGVFRSGGTNPYRAYVAMLGGRVANNFGVSWLQSKDPCPATQGPNDWENFEPDISATVSSPDYPVMFYNTYSDTVWATFEGFRNSNNQRTFWMYRVGPTGGVFNLNPFNCNDHSIGGGVKAVNDKNGDIHVMYQDNTENSDIKHVVFTSRGSFDCRTISLIGHRASGPGATYGSMGDGNLGRAEHGSIAIDRATGTLVAAYENYLPPVGDQPGTFTTNVFRSTNGGTSWTFMGSPCCGHDIRPRVASALQSNRFHILLTSTLDLTSPNPNIYQRDLVSTDGGLTWSTNFLTQLRSVTPLPGGYWGHYDGAVADSGGTFMYYVWGEANPNKGNFWGIKGIKNDP